MRDINLFEDGLKPRGRILQRKLFSPVDSTCASNSNLKFPANVVYTDPVCIVFFKLNRLLSPRPHAVVWIATRLTPSHPHRPSPAVIMFGDSRSHCERQVDHMMSCLSQALNVITCRASFQDFYDGGSPITDPL